MRFKIEGTIPAMLTPFTKGGVSVDHDKAAALATRLAGQGVQGVFIAGTTGEGMLLTPQERKDLLATIVSAVGKKIKVLAHTGCLDTATTIELTQHAAKSGAVAAGVVAPGFYGYDDAALKKFYTTVAGSVKGFPVFLYNLPSCAKNALKPPLVAELAEKVDNIVGIKDSGGDMTVITEYLGGVSSDFNVICGCDSFGYQALLAGTKGSVSSTANVFPELFTTIFDGVKKGDLKKAWKAQVTLADACKVFQYGAMVARYKEALRMRGFEAGYVRSPQRELTTVEKKDLQKKLAALGLL